MFDVWDPIDIKDVPSAKGESDLYIGRVFGLLSKGGSEEEISAYLWKIIEEKIHRHPAKGATEAAAKALRRIRME